MMNTICMFNYPKAPCSAIVDTFALKALPYHNLGGNVYTIELHSSPWVKTPGGAREQRQDSRPRSRDVPAVLGVSLTLGIQVYK